MNFLEFGDRKTIPEEEIMRNSLWNALATNATLAALALTLSCSCLCRQSPVVGTASFRIPGQDASGKGEVWRFAVSGDSRNCGDVVMPAIAAGAKKDGAQFYWHLGDLRAIYDFDDDMRQESKMAGKELTILDYENTAWDDFYKNQVAPFQNIPIPFYLGIGNHETMPPRDRCQFVKRFADLLDRPEFEEGKKTKASPSEGNSKMASSKGKPSGASEKKSAQPQDSEVCGPVESKTYYHWIRAGVDFIYLDNATSEQFDDNQWKWFQAVIKDAEANKDIHTVVVGMHKALPWSVSCDHSMNESAQGIAGGVKVYRALLDLQKKEKKVYVLASHSHYFMMDIFNTGHWRKNGGILPGWIVGTAGAQRYVLPAGADLAKSRANDYGYLLGRVFSDGTIDFEFTELKSADVPSNVRDHYGRRFVSETCFAENRLTVPPPEKDYCKETP